MNIRLGNIGQISIRLTAVRSFADWTLQENGDGGEPWSKTRSLLGLPRPKWSENRREEE